MAGTASLEAELSATVTSEAKVSSSASAALSAAASVVSESAVSSSANAALSATAAVVSESAVAGSANAEASASGAVLSEAVVSGSTDCEATLSADVDETDEPTLPVTSGLVHHWDASSDSNTVTTGEMVTLADLSASGNDATALSGDDGGAVQSAGLNGRDYVSYNGTDESNGAASPSNMPALDDDRTVFCVDRFPDTGADVLGFVYGRNQQHQVWGHQMDSGGLGPDNFGLQIFNDFYDADSGSYDEWAIRTLTHTDSGNVLAFRKDGASDGSASGTNVFTGSDSMDLVVVGARLDGTNQQYDFAEVLVYDRVLNGTEIGQVESYLSTKWGISIS